MSEPLMKVLFACGGTGGHIFPAVAISEVLSSQYNADIFFAGRKNSMEERILSDRYNFIPITAVPLQRGKLFENLFLPYKLLTSIWSGYSALKKSGAEIVIGTGGYVSLPVLLAAFVKRVPVYVQEQNSVAGVANKIAARFAKKIFVASEGLVNKFGVDKTVVSGNPIRGFSSTSSNSRPEEYARYENKKIVLVLGGSQGAKGINEKLLESLKKIEEQQDYVLIWQVGQNNLKEFEAKTAHATNVVVKGFIDNVMGYMQHADLLISRAGASTLAEILVLGRPSILVPFPFATANHQEHNARDLEKVGAALIELESENNELCEKVRYLISHEDDLERMKKQAESLAKPNAAKEIVEVISELENAA